MLWFILVGLLRISYYPHGNRGPVQKYLEELRRLRPEAAARLALDLEILGAEGLRSSRISVRGFGRGLWEVRRRFERVWYRVFVCVTGNSVWLLHSIEKKSPKTPQRDVELAMRRMREVMNQ